jgi:hypothetical protein
MQTGQSGVSYIPYVDASGNVGIGTTTPTYSLHAAISSEQAYSTTPSINDAGIIIRAQNLSNTAGTFAGIDLQAGTYTSSAARISVINDTGPIDTNSTLTFSVRSLASSNAITERLRITSGGNVLIGKTSDNGNKLQVEGGISVKPLTSTNPTNNGEMVFELTSNTQLKIKVKGSDGVIRSASLTLA